MGDIFQVFGSGRGGDTQDTPTVRTADNLFPGLDFFRSSLERFRVGGESLSV